MTAQENFEQKCAIFKIQKIEVFKIRHLWREIGLREVAAGNDAVIKAVPVDGNRAAKFVSRVLNLFLFTAVFQLHLQCRA